MDDAELAVLCASPAPRPPDARRLKPPSGCTASRTSRRSSTLETLAAGRLARSLARPGQGGALDHLLGEVAEETHPSSNPAGTARAPSTSPPRRRSPTDSRNGSPRSSGRSPRSRTSTAPASVGSVHLPLTLILALLAPAAASAQTQPTGCRRIPFQVLHSDHIGALSLRQGNYTIITRSSVTCARASACSRCSSGTTTGACRGRGPSTRPTARSSAGRARDGFAVRRTSGGGTAPPRGTHPADGTRCGATFLVQNNDRIRLLTAAQARNVTLLEGGGLSCPGLRASSRVSCSARRVTCPRPGCSRSPRPRSAPRPRQRHRLQGQAGQRAVVM